MHSGKQRLLHVPVPERLHNGTQRTVPPSVQPCVHLLLLSLSALCDVVVSVCDVVVSACDVVISACDVVVSVCDVVITVCDVVVSVCDVVISLSVML